MKTITVKPGMRFVCSDDQLKNRPYLKDYSYTVIKKHGRGFIVRFFNGIGCGEDFFEKYELERMKLV